MYLSEGLIHSRCLELENYVNECIWVAVQCKDKTYLLGSFYRPRATPVNCWNKIHDYIEHALDLSNNIILTCDFNENLLDLRLTHFKDVLTLNNVQNVLSEPSRGRSLLDPIILSRDLSYLQEGVIDVTPEISDHNACFVIIPFSYSFNSSFTRHIWIYKDADFTRFNNLISETDWSVLHNGSVHSACRDFSKLFLEHDSQCIQNKQVLIRSNDKPWYDSTIRKLTRIRDRRLLKIEENFINSACITKL